MKKLMFLVAFVLFGFIFIYSSTTFAQDKNGNNENTDENLMEFNRLVDDGILPDNISYDEWAKINDQALFDELEVPNVTISNGDPNSINTLANTFTLQRGDILISNGTSSLGLTGHAGIAISSSEILHISGYGKTPQVVSVNTWRKQYGLIKGQLDGVTNTKVYRIDDSKVAYNAGSWAIANYRFKNYRYGLTGYQTSKNPTYCSKIVWQAYNSQKKAKAFIGIIGPYQLPNKITGAKGLGIM